jgi:putative membrane protein
MICQHLNHSPEKRDRAIAWTVSFPVACKQLLRGERRIPRKELAGVLTWDDISLLQAARHPPHYVAAEMRNAIYLALSVDCDSNNFNNQDSAAAAIYRSSVARSLENMINSLIQNIGAMERIRHTPLPIIYTTHLRTYLLLYLFTLPYLYGSSWGYLTVFAVFLTSFGLLGIDGAAAECELPFSKNRANHLDMETYCLTAMNNVAQILIHYANMDMRSAAEKEFGTVHGKEHKNWRYDGLTTCNNLVENINNPPNEHLSLNPILLSPFVDL